MEYLLRLLNELEEFTKTIPERTQNQILTFNALEMDEEKMSISEYIPKLKIQMLKNRRDALMELKIMLKRRRNMSHLLSIEDSDESHYADASCHSLIWSWPRQSTHLNLLFINSLFIADLFLLILIRLLRLSRRVIQKFLCLLKNCIWVFIIYWS